MELNILWFVLIAVLWTGYLVLEGFDFGVGMLLKILPTKDDKVQQEKERRVLINTIGPVWDGNQVWLLTAGGATFAAFPHWYATLFSGFYLPLLLILVALIFRGMAFEYRGKAQGDGWRSLWDWCIVLGSFLPALLWGVAFANLVRGVPLVAVDGVTQYDGGFFNLLNPFALLGGLCTLSLFLMHGAVYLTLKTDGKIRERARAFATKAAIAAVVIAGGWAVWAQLAYSVAWTWIAVLVAALCLVGVVLTTAKGKEGLSFILSAAVMPAAVTLIFGSMSPNVMVGTDPATSLSIDAASSTNTTLTIMTWVAGIMVPIVLAYTAWAYWTFRYRVTSADIPASIALSLKKKVGEAFGGPNGAGALDLTIADTRSKASSAG